jgi:type VI secretion system secreted protein VgrG
MSLSQENRFLTIETPLGRDVLALVAIKGSDAMSSGFHYELDMFSEDAGIAFKDIVGERLTVSIKMSNGDKRYINGIVSTFEQVNRADETEKGLTRRNFFYRAEIVPWSWLLSRMINNRIFQEKDVQEIVQQVFDDRGAFDYEWNLSDNYNKRNYCVQYNETDLNFVSRLLEEEGIHYFYRHENGSHTMVLADSPNENPPCPFQQTVRFRAEENVLMDEDFIFRLGCARKITANKYTLTDYNFEAPASSLLVETDTNQQSNSGGGQREIYRYPGNYSEYSDGERFGRLRMETEEVGITTVTGESHCRGFIPGYRFTLAGYIRKEMNDKDYLLVSVDLKAHQGWHELGDRRPDHFTNQFHCIPHDVPFRPRRRSRRPRVRGIQTAIVVGPSGEEIYPDEYGRVKVQFHWDREGRKDDKSSCWIRVSQAWAGGGWGAMYIPRIGQEVIVEFIDGDPDRPIITGSVYHGNNMPPYNLPSEKTKSTIKSDSSKGGGGSNELRFEDKKGEEEIYLHGQKDWQIKIENNKIQDVGANDNLTVASDRNKTIGNNQDEKVGANKTIIVGANHTETVGARFSQNVGSQKSETIGAAKTETIGGLKALTIGGAYQVSVGAAMNATVGGAKGEEVGAAKFVAVGKNNTIEVGSDMRTKVGKEYRLIAKKINIEAKDEMTLKVGKAEFTLRKNGDIKLNGKKINLKATGDITIKGSKTSLNP